MVRGVMVAKREMVKRGNGEERNGKVKAFWWR